MLLPVEWVYVERTFLVIILGILCIMMAAFGEERPAAQSVYTTGLVALSYFIGERTGSMDIGSRGATYLGVSVWLVYLLSFAFMLYCTVAIDLSDERKLKRAKEWCTISIAACATLYCIAKLSITNLLIERLRIIRNTGIPRYSDRKWMFPMALVLPYAICLVFLLIDMYHKYHGNDCYIGVYQRGILILIIWNAICSFTIGGMYLHTLARSDTSRQVRGAAFSKKAILIPEGMTKMSIIGATTVWICASCANLMTFLYKTAYKEHICLMNCSADLIVGIIVTDYLSGLTAERVQQEALAFVIAKKIGRMELDDLGYLFELEEPNIIQTSFRNITAILQQFKAYVPRCVLENIDAVISVPIPAIPIDVVRPPSGEVTIVFTDIKSSSLIWGELPDEMRSALRTHNKVIRECITQCQGYEVKTIGDSFMVAFENPTSGVEFGIAVQMKLFEATWPESLSQLAPCRSASGAWNGVRVRIGVHHGYVNAEASMMTGRVDYLGPTVNTAARLEGICEPGGVAVSATTLSLVAREYMSESNPIIIEKGEVALRGIRTPIKIGILYPCSLGLRSEGDRPPPQCVLFPHKQPLQPIHRNDSSIGTSRSSSMVSLLRDDPTSFIKKIPSTLGRLMIRPRPSEFGCINDTFSLVSTCLARTDGITVGVTGNVVTFSWNVSRRVDNHALSALRFADMYAAYQRKGQRPYLLSVLAIATSTSYSGSIRAGDEKFVTVVGDALGLTTTQLYLAEEQQIFCTYASTHPQKIEYLASILRPLDIMNLRRRLALPEKIQVFEVSICGWSDGLNLFECGEELGLDKAQIMFESRAAEIVDTNNTPIVFNSYV